MIPVCTAGECREIDRRAIEELGVPGAALMEVAGRGLALLVRDRLGEAARRGVAVVCGPGNNGGDGYVAARWLRGWGYDVHTWSLAPASKGDAALYRRAALAAGVPEVEGLGDCGVVVDAVFGTGLDREVTGTIAAALLRMDEHPAPKVAADLPSGLHSDTGAELGVCVTAAYTACFGRLKRGLFCGVGAVRAGQVALIDLGFDAVPGEVGAELATDALMARWPRRSAAAHKGDSGHLLVVAGSLAMAGAAVLTCRGALAAGAGRITLHTASGALARLGALPPEVMLRLDGDEVITSLGDLRGFSAIVAGPGLGGGVDGAPREALAALWATLKAPVLFDADALVPDLGPSAGPRVVTPHPGEAARMLRATTAEVQADRFGAAEALGGFGVAVLKGQHSLVSRPGRTSVNATGGPVLATAGSGDVLAGVIGALLARGLSAWDAARVGVWAHGAAGDRLGSRRPEGWSASDIADEIARGA